MTGRREIDGTTGRGADADLAPDHADPVRSGRRLRLADLVGAIGALVVLSSALVGWAGTGGGVSGTGELRPPSGIVRSVDAFTPAPLVAALVPLWSLGRRASGGRPLPGWLLVVVGALILLLLAGGGAHLVSEAVGHRAPEVYTVPEGAVAVAALGASAIIAAGLAGIFAASSTLDRRPR